ncbi:MAG TPA: hypothetical protein VG346_05485 [Acidimicrobiales bacterium]|nr:hypothetical protein [Acidimicrobiales bacterium]
MIGGDISSSSVAQEVVWIHGAIWSDKQVTHGLETAIFETSSSFANAATALSRATGDQGIAAAYSGLEETVQSNMATIAGLALHTRGHRQLQLGAIDSAWGSLHHSLVQIANSAQNSAAIDESILLSDVRAIVVAERNAGIVSNLTLPAGVPV